MVQPTGSFEIRKSSRQKTTSPSRDLLQPEGETKVKVALNFSDYKNVNDITAQWAERAPPC